MKWYFTDIETLGKMFQRPAPPDFGSGKPPLDPASIVLSAVITGAAGGLLSLAGLAAYLGVICFSRGTCSIFEMTITEGTAFWPTNDPLLLFIVALLSVFVGSMVQFPIGFHIISGILFLASKVLGGVGDYWFQTYLIGIVVNPLYMITRSTILIPGVNLFTLIVMFPLVMFGIFRSLRVAHKLSALHTLIALGLPVLGFAIVALLLFILPVLWWVGVI